MAALNHLRAWAGAVLALAWRGRCAGRRLLQRHGWLPALLLVCSLVSGIAWWGDHTQGRRLQALQRDVAALDAVRASAPVALPAQPGAETRLQAFEQLLTPYSSLADVVQDVLQLGAQEGLIMQRGEYREQVDLAGGFVRYHMTLPVKGNPQAVQRLIQRALLAQRALALASVQYRRERPESLEMEARIEWVVHASLPASAPLASAGRKESQ